MPIPFPTAVDTVLFDFDGTLMDASSAICGAFRAALGESNMPEDRIRAMIGRPLRDMFLSVRPDATDHDVDILVARYREAFLPLSLTATFPLPGAAHTVQVLRETMRLAVVTTRMADGAIRMLRTHGMLDAFEFVIGLEHVQRPKPDPQPVQHALHRLGSDAGRAVMVGDTPDDILAGCSAGTGTIGVTTGAFDEPSLRAAGAHFVIDSLERLPALLLSQPAAGRIKRSR
jgi:HAD superfamily hydrolase (TIGR01509 family)